MASPAALVIPALKRHTSTVIVAHGLGDSGAGWYDATRSQYLSMLTVNNRQFLAEAWRRKGKFEETAFIFPNAPTIPITIVGWRLANT